MIRFNPGYKHYVLRYRTDGALVGLDRDSGGYPYKAYASNIHYWNSADKAQDYIRMFPELEGPFEVFGLFELGDIKK